MTRRIELGDLPVIENDKFQVKPESSVDLVSVVEATIRDEMSAVQNSLIDFSIGMQWAVRQI